jgi:hypothetical protein
MTRILLMILALGCTTQGDSGTSVGNPGKVSLSMGEGERYAIARAVVEVESVELETCAGARIEVPVQDEMDLLDSDFVHVPHGEWCSVQLITEAPIEIEVFIEFDEEDEDDVVLGFDLQIDLEDAIILGGEGFRAEGNGFILELGEPGWIDQDFLEPEDDMVYGPESETSLAYFEIIQTTSQLYEDPDLDGELSDSEREEDPVATSLTDEDSDHGQDNESSPSDSDDTGEDDGRQIRGCSSIESPLPSHYWGVVLLIGLLRRRRH